MAGIRIDNATDALVVVDVQNDFCPGGALAVPDGDAVVPVINRLIGLFDHVVLTQDWHPEGHDSFASSHPGKNPLELITVAYGDQVLWPDHCVQGTAGADFHAGLDATKAEMVIRKGYRREIDSYSAFYENDQTTPTGLAGSLKERGFKRLFFTGLATDFCVGWSALDARKEGFDAVLVDDACRAIDFNGSLDAAHAAFKENGVAVVTSADIS